MTGLGTAYPSPLWSAESAYLETAARIGVRLCRDARWAGDRCNWIGPSHEPVDGKLALIYRAYGPDVYAGTSGIALFLGQLHRLTGERLFRVTAEGALQQSLSRWDAIRRRDRVGFFSGLTGIAYVASRLGELFGQEHYMQSAELLIEELARSDVSVAGVDVINGCAGAIPALIDLHARGRHDANLDLAVRFGDYVIEKARKRYSGWSWETTDVPVFHNLTGFGHGAGGIGWGLLELHHYTVLERFCNAALEAFRYERHWYKTDRENWPDFRNFTGKPIEVDEPYRYTAAWCHGAAGICLSRLRAFEFLRDNACEEEARAGMRTTRKTLDPSAPTFLDNFSLCHGLAGNAEIAAKAASVLCVDMLTHLAADIARLGMERYELAREPWPCGVAGAGEAPGLMLGTAGIGYFYLRLYDPVGVPSVLLPAPRYG